jgi:protein TonB
VVKRQVQAAQKKLSQHLYYPPEAIARGIEGEVRLIITLTEDGSIADVNIAASSGHPILDNAAIKAAYATGKLSGATSRELILPVIFRLQ